MDFAAPHCNNGDTGRRGQSIPWERSGSAPGGKRKEDPALLAGKGRFVDDVRLPGTLHADLRAQPPSACEKSSPQHLLVRNLVQRDQVSGFGALARCAGCVAQASAAVNGELTFCGHQFLQNWILSNLTQSRFPLPRQR
jgi:hypothetical protein